MDLATPVPRTAIAAEAPAHAASTVRYRHLDGIRGIAAFYVMFYHVWLILVPDGDWRHAPIPSVIAFWWAAWGRSAVPVFITLSGYCLMLPVIKAGGMPGGAGQFFLRRIRRTLPAYYAALLLAFLLAATIPAIFPATRHSEAWGIFWVAHATLGGAFSHLLLVHNLCRSWSEQFDAPMWSIGLEWQIYVLFAFVLLPILRRFNIQTMVVFSFAIGMLPHFVLHLFDWTAPWHVGLFSLGVLGALITHDPAYARWQNAPWRMIARGLFAGYLLFALAELSLNTGYHDAMQTWYSDTLAGLVTAALLVHCFVSMRAGGASRALRILEAPSAQYIGKISYSLYLTHAIVLMVVLAIMETLSLSPMARLVLMPCCIPLALLSASLLYRVAEAPYLSRAR